MALHQMRTQAERDVRGAILLDRIAEAEKINVPEEEVEAEIAEMAKMYKTTPEEITASIERQGGTGSIAGNLRTRKSIEKIVEKAKITDGPWVDEDAGDVTPSIDSDPEAADKKPKKAAKKKAPAKKAAKSKTAE
jgi:trigger factor